MLLILKKIFKITAFLFLLSNLFGDNEIEFKGKISFSDLEKNKDFFLSNNKVEILPINIPLELRKFLNKKVLISGYIIGGGKIGENKYQYMLAKYMWDWCCQGIPPTPFTNVIINSDKPIVFTRNSSVTIYGTFILDVNKNENGSVFSFFALNDSVIKESRFKMESHYLGFLALIIFLIYQGSLKIFQKIQKNTKKKISSIEDNNAFLIRAKKLSIGYGEREILSNFEINIKKGDLWGVIGPNGSGKTTLIRSIMGIIPPLKGSLKRKKNLKFGYVKQRQFLDDLFPFTVFELVMMGRYSLIGLNKRPSKNDIIAVDYSLSVTGISNLRDVPLRELSGGQKQRAIIARALSSEPELIIFDEPTNDMDLKGEDAVISLIKNIHEEKNIAVLIVSHLLPVVLNISENILFLKGDNNFDIYTREELINGNHLQSLYGLPVNIIKKQKYYSIIMDGAKNV